MAASDDDRLSGLSDDVLRRILHFAPAREGASTSALSTRWTRSPLWLGSGAVNLEIFLADIHEYRHRFYSKRDTIVSRAHQALDAADEAGVPVTRLTFRVEAPNVNTINQFLHRDASQRYKRDVVAHVISHGVVRLVEELQIAAVDLEALKSQQEMDKEVSSHALEIYRLRVGSLPSKNLRCLDLTNCSGLELPSSSAIAFPKLASLRLRRCSVPLVVLQSVIDAAPVLTVIHLESAAVTINSDSGSDDSSPRKPSPEDALRLSCSAATVLVLDRCAWREQVCLEIDAPRLRRFRYRGVLRPILRTPPSLDLVHADLTILAYTTQKDEDPRDVRRNFWRFVHSYIHAKEMKLGVGNLEEIAVASKAQRVKLLPEFCNLERLELEGLHRPTGKTAAVAIANLLRCCPALRDLRMKLSKPDKFDSASMRSLYDHDLLKKRDSSDLQDSINRFKRHRSEPMVAGDEDEDSKYDDVPDILALSGRSFECLQSSLRRVGLQFREAKTDCFGVKLIKFFAENSLILEEMCIDSGTDKLYEHLNPKVETWIFNSSKRRKVDSTSNATKFLVSPLERRS